MSDERRLQASTSLNRVRQGSLHKDQNPAELIRQVVGEGPEPRCRSRGLNAGAARTLATALSEAGFASQGDALRQAVDRWCTVARAIEVASRAEQAFKEPAEALSSQERYWRRQAHLAAEEALHSCDDPSGLDMLVVHGAYTALTRPRRQQTARLMGAAASALEELELTVLADEIREDDNDLFDEHDLDPDNTGAEMAAWALAQAASCPSLAGDEEWLKCQGLLRLAQYLARGEADSLCTPRPPRNGQRQGAKPPMRPGDLSCP